jgi:hypothetical protein
VLLLVIVLWVFLRLDDVYIYTLDCTRVGKKKIEGGDSPSGRIDPSSRSPHPVQYTRGWIVATGWRFLFPSKTSIADAPALLLLLLLLLLFVFRVCLPVTRWEVEYSRWEG